MKLGQLLLHRGVIDRDQLREGLRRQRESGRPIGQVLLAMGVVSRSDVVAALLSQPQGSVDRETLARVRDDTLRTLPAELCRRHRCVAVVRTADFVVVALEDPTDGAAIDAVQPLVEEPVLPVAVPADALEEVLEERLDAAVAGGLG